MKWWSQQEADTIRQQAAAMEQAGTLSWDVLEIIYHHRLFKLFISAEMGGALLPLPEAIRVFEEAARIDGSFGWLVTIGSGGGYFAGIFSGDVAVRLFTPTDAVVAGSGYVGGVAQRVEGGYHISGIWRYCSGADYATIFTANCRIDDTDQVLSFIFRPDQVTVRHDWDTHGLRATGSHTIVVKDALVPDYMTFDIANGERSDTAEIYRYPFLPFAEASFAAVCAGICRHYLEEALAMIQIYDKPEDPRAIQRYQRVTGVIRAQEQLLYTELEKFYHALSVSWHSLLDEGKGEGPEYEEVGNRSRRLAEVALSTAQAVYPWLGLSAAMQHSAINRIWRDLHTASQHILLKEF